MGKIGYVCRLILEILFLIIYCVCFLVYFLIYFLIYFLYFLIMKLLLLIKQQRKHKFNILIAGATGVGKSSLINAFFGKEIAKAGVGEPVTQRLEKFEVKDKGLVLWDTKGIEAKNYQGTIRQLDSELETEFKMAKNVGDVPHLAWLCIDLSGARIEPRDMELVSILRRHGLLLVVVFTKDMGPDSDAFIDVAIDEINAKHAASIRGRFARVNSVERCFTGFTLPVSDLEELYNISLECLEEGLENATEVFKQVQRVKMKKRWQAMVSGARRKVYIAGGLVLVLFPILADLIIDLADLIIDKFRKY